MNNINPEINYYHCTTTLPINKKILPMYYKVAQNMKQIL